MLQLQLCMSDDPVLSERGVSINMMRAWVPSMSPSRVPAAGTRIYCSRK